MQFPRCGECNNCKRIEQVKPSVLRCANPPFSHATDDTALVWNQTLFDNPCEQWTGEQKSASRAHMLLLDQKIRPVPAVLQLQLTVKVTYNRHGELPRKLIKKLLDVMQRAYADGGITGNSEAEIDDWSQEVDIVDQAIDCVVSVANILGLDCEDLDDLVHDAASNPASEINNQGLDDQVRFLCQQLGTKYVFDKLYDLKKEPE